MISMGTMYPHVTIYEAGKSGNHSEKSLHASPVVRVYYHLLRGVGLGLMVLALAGVLFLTLPFVKEEIYYSLSQWSGKESLAYQEIDKNDLLKAEKTVAVQKEAESNGVDSYFSVVIPRIEAKSKVVANVDPWNEVAYKAALREGIAHAKGTYFPGQGKNIYLFSHSTDFDFNVARYNAVFYLLRKLEPGDKVIVFFSDKKYEYEVEEKVVVPSGDISWLVNRTEAETLFLQTCDPPGTTWKRLIIKAKRV